MREKDAIGGYKMNEQNLLLRQQAVVMLRGKWYRGMKAGTGMAS